MKDSKQVGSWDGPTLSLSRNPVVKVRATNAAMSLQQSLSADCTARSVRLTIPHCICHFVSIQRSQTWSVGASRCWQKPVPHTRKGYSGADESGGKAYQRAPSLCSRQDGWDCRWMGLSMAGRMLYGPMRPNSCSIGQNFWIL